MKHLAARSRSMYNEKPFTAPGLGDRIHHCTVAWCYGTPVTLHLTADKWRGGKFKNKPESWAEVAALFPPGAISFKVHRVEGLPEAQWTQRAGVPVWKYGDVPSEDVPGAVDVEPLLRNIPRLEAAPQDVPLPKRFFTVQWDASSNRRSAPIERRDQILAQYAGLKPVVIGGEAQGVLQSSLAHIAYALSRAEFHVGGDSAFMHMALLYLPPPRVHIWTSDWTHHTRRLRANGGQVTFCGTD